MEPAVAAAHSDDFKLAHTVLLDAIQKGRLVPVLGGDINLSGRPLENNTPINWEQDPISYPPSTSELALYLLRIAKGQRGLDPDVANLLEIARSSPSPLPMGMLGCGASRKKR